MLVYQRVHGWRYLNPSEKIMDFVSWDDEIPNWMAKEKMFQTTNQVLYSTPNLR